jgi:hypothetical protein
MNHTPNSARAASKPATTLDSAIWRLCVAPMMDWTHGIDWLLPINDLRRRAVNA